MRNRSLRKKERKEKINGSVFDYFVGGKIVKDSKEKDGPY